MLYELGSGGMKRIDVAANDKKNNLPIGTVLKLNGYSDPEYVVVKNEGINEKFRGYGARYLTVSLEDFRQSRHDAFSMKDIKEKKNGGIQMYFTDEILPGRQVLDIYNRAKLLERQKQQRQAEAEAERKKRVEKGKALFARYIPAEAKALIVANHEQDACDLMTDYFATTVTETVILGFSKHKRDIFTEMRKFAHKIPETAHLAEPPEINENGEKKTKENSSWWHPSDEHREKYSGGSGYYLKAGSPYSTGWRIHKYVPYNGQWAEHVYESLAKRCVFGPDNPEPESKAEQTQGPKPESDVQIGEYKGHPVITLPLGSKGFSFGLSKARTIVKHFEAIRKFAETAQA